MPKITDHGNRASSTGGGINALRRFHDESTGAEPLDALVTLARAELRETNYDRAVAALKQLGEHPSELVHRGVKDAIADIKSQHSTEIQALLIGIDEYQDSRCADLKGAANDVAAVEEILGELGVTGIKVLINDDADRAAILRHYKRLIKRAADTPVFFYFAGYGSLDREWMPTILSCDARTESPQGVIEDISLKALARSAATSKRNVVAIVDAGRGPLADVASSPNLSSRFVYPVVEIAEEPATDSIAESELAQFSARIEYPKGESRLASPFEPSRQLVHGTLTHNVVSGLRAILDRGVHPSTWKRTETAPFRSQWPIFESFWMPLFDTRSRDERLDEAVKSIRHLEIRELLRLLDDVAARWPAEAAETHLDRCILAAFIEDYPASIQAAQDVMQQFDGSTELATEAKYHHGRVLFESGENLLLAVDQLQKVVDESDADMRARYFLGQAILKLVQADYAPKASKHLQQYIEHGAPLGHYGDVLTTMARLDESSRQSASAVSAEPDGDSPRFDRIVRRTYIPETLPKLAAPSATAMSVQSDTRKPALKKWELGSVLNVMILNGSEEERAEVERAAAEWARYCNISFDFIGDPNRAAIRAEFGSSGTWSYLGIDSLRLPGSQATMAFPGEEGLGGVDLRVHALRNFGHALGLGNEQTQPNAKLPWNKQAVYIYYQRMYGWSRSTADRNLLAVSPNNGLGIEKPFDRDSIMMLPTPGELLLDGIEITTRTELSEGDKQFIAKLYPMLEPNGEYLNSALTERVVTHRHKLPINRPGNYIIETDSKVPLRIQLANAALPNEPIGLWEPKGEGNHQIRKELGEGAYHVTVNHAVERGGGHYRIRVSADK